MDTSLRDNISSTTKYVDVNSGRIAYEVTGEGPLVVLSPGMADVRSTYRFLAPLIATAGYRVASVDLRGHGDSSIGWSSYTHADTAADLLAVIKHLGGPAIIVGQSFSGGATTLAAVSDPALVSAIVEIAPFTRPPKTSIGAILKNSHNYRSGALQIGRFFVTGSTKAWSRYLDIAYPKKKPADWDSWLSILLSNLSQQGRAAAAQKMMNSKATLQEAARKLPAVSCPVLIIMGTADSDFPDPEAEASAIVGLLPTGSASYTMIDQAGHYPHAQYPEQVAEAILPFISTNSRA